ncbi:hypothetical protein HDU77_003205 [Chytriomyces hyalinus]|nr:hypothetical protein HDU77_003205 [Chytriomyces hyalinus]
MSPEILLSNSDDTGFSSFPASSHHGYLQHSSTARFQQQQPTPSQRKPISIPTASATTSTPAVPPSKRPASGSTQRSTLLRQQVTQPTTSFYKRSLPTTCTSFQSREGRAIFAQALQGPYMECYYNLAMHYTTQSEPAYCGLSTLVMSLNALGVDPLRQWKGVWRWFDESTIETVRDLKEIQVDGITLCEFECIARMNGLAAESKRADTVTKDSFLRDLKRACASQSEVLAVSYHRGTLNQTGTGHFSPVGGFNEESNQVLVFDVARFKYTAYWVSLDLLWESMLPIDESTGKPRGYCLLSKGKRGLIHSAIGKISESYTQPWPIAVKRLVKDLIVSKPLLETFPSAAQEKSFHRASESLLSFESQTELYESLPLLGGRTTEKRNTLEQVVDTVLKKIPADFFAMSENALFAPPLDESLMEPFSKHEKTSPYFPDDMRLHLSQTHLYNLVRKALYKRQQLTRKSQHAANIAAANKSRGYPYFSVVPTLGSSNDLNNATSLTPSSPGADATHSRSISENAPAFPRFTHANSTSLPSCATSAFSSAPAVTTITSTAAASATAANNSSTIPTGNNNNSANNANPHCSKTHAICECDSYIHGDYFSRCKRHVHGYTDFVAFLTLCVAAIVSAGQVVAQKQNVTAVRQQLKRQASVPTSVVAGHIVAGGVSCENAGVAGVHAEDGFDVDCMCRLFFAVPGAESPDTCANVVAGCFGNRVVEREVSLLRDSFLAISLVVK